MKTIANLLILLGITCTMQAQHSLQSDLNLPRPGDEIIKQQVEYKDPGRIGENVLWDFGQLSIINDQYKLVYSEPFLIGDSIYLMGKETYRVTDYPDAQLFIGTEHHTRYYYLFQDSLLWALGHENAATALRYIKPLLSGVFPLAYGEIHADTYSAQGVYSGRVPFENAGKVEIKADAFGMMVLPSGDTLRQVVRTKILRHFSEILPATDGDTVSVNTVLENYQWYSKGYRYPVFETFHSTVSEDTTEIDRFETAFFFPPQEQYYLQDEANLAVLDSLANENLDPWAGLTYNIYPNPVKAEPLSVELYLPQPATVRVQVRNTMGGILLDKTQGTYPVGICNFQFSLQGIQTNNYILDIWLNEKLISETIMKR